MKRPVSTQAFTLIELLVVVTIIVVLLALLVPAMNKAVYQATLAVCAAQLHGIATGAQTYAMAHKRSYPNRPGQRGGSGGTYSMVRLRTGPNYDNRLDVRRAFDLDLLNCPLTGKLDLKDFDEPEPIKPSIYSPYHLWFGIQYKVLGITEKGIFRMGDRFTFTQVGTPTRLLHFSTLASDRDLFSDDGRVHGTHPDDRGVMSNTVLQNQVHPYNGVAADPYIMSQWENNETNQRGLIDMNFAFDDGSVLRYDKLRPEDERMEPVPDLVGGDRWYGWRTFLPER